MKKIEISREVIDGISSLIIKCSGYDEELKEDIKALPTRDRKWQNDSNSWIVVEDSPTQEEYEETNLEYVRRVVKACIDRRQWTLVDYTDCKTKEEVEAKVQQTEAELYENHVSAILAVLSKLPVGCLKLIRWGDKIIKLQLTGYLDADREKSYELFMELFRACTQTWKPWLLSSLDRKMTSGYVFEMAADDRILKTLLPLRVKNLEYQRQLQLVQAFEDGIAHFEDTYTGKLWIGADYKLLDMSDHDFDSSSWLVAASQERVYWVEDREKFVKSWLEESSSSPVYFGGAFAVFVSQQSRIVENLKFFHLEDWFKEWANSLLESETITNKFPGQTANHQWHEWGWEHPADSLLSHFKRMNALKEFLRYDTDYIQTVESRIKALKAVAAKRAIEKSKKNIADLVVQYLPSKKQELLDFLTKQGIPIKKSWTIERAIQELLKHKEVCYKIAKIPDTDSK